MAYKPESGITTISFSELSRYLDCPHGWHLDYYGPGKDISEKNQYLAYGSAIHAGIQHLCQERDVEKSKLHYLDEVAKGFKEANCENLLEHYSPLGCHFIDAFTKTKYYTSMKLHSVENQIFTHIKDHDVHFKGFIDLAFNEVNNTLTFVDLKTSKRGWDNKTRSSFTKIMQLLLYKKMQQFSPIEKIKCEFVILNESKKQVETFQISSTAKEVERSERILLNALTKMYKEKKVAFKNNQACRFCRWNETEHCDKQSKIVDFVDLSLLIE